MTYSDKELLFISNLFTKLGNNVLDISKTHYNFDSKEFRTIREISIMTDFWANTRHTYVDIDGNEINYKKCKTDEATLSRYIDFLRHRYRMGSIPYIDYPKRKTDILFDLLCGTGNTFPEGGGPGYYLTKDGSGNLKWEKLGECLEIFRFTTPSAEVNPPPYTFFLSTLPKKVFFVSVNGQILENKDNYTYLDGNLTIYSPIILDNASLTVWAGCSDVKIVEGFGKIKSVYTWNTGDPYTFTTSLPIGEIEQLTVNGVEIIPFSDFTYTVGATEFEIIAPNELENLDELFLKYWPTDGTPEVDGIFDASFDNTFE